MTVMQIIELDHAGVLNCLPDRNAYAHKGNFGKILLLCGSRGYTGAAALAAMGALRSGAGLVYLAVPESIYHIEATKLTEPIVYPLPDENGMYSKDVIPAIDSMLKNKHAVLIGPGMGISSATSEVLKYVLTHFEGPVIVDADGITLLQAHKDVLRRRTAPTVITPHEGEFIRIGGTIAPDRTTAAIQLAKELGIIVVLKGHHTIITDGSTCYRNLTGNPGMATGGSGDVLAGIITSLIGQGIAPLAASACGAWLHGAAGDICADEIGQYGMIPSDLLHVLPRLLK